MFASLRRLSSRYTRNREDKVHSKVHQTIWHPQLHQAAAAGAPTRVRLGGGEEPVMQAYLAAAANCSVGKMVHMPYQLVSGAFKVSARCMACVQGSSVLVVLWHRGTHAWRRPLLCKTVLVCSYEVCAVGSAAAEATFGRLVWVLTAGCSGVSGASLTRAYGSRS